MEYKVFLPSDNESSDYGYISCEGYKTKRTLKEQDVIVLADIFYEVEFVTYNNEFKSYCIYVKKLSDVITLNGNKN